MRGCADERARHSTLERQPSASAVRRSYCRPSRSLRSSLPTGLSPRVPPLSPYPPTPRLHSISDALSVTAASPLQLASLRVRCAKTTHLHQGVVYGPKGCSRSAKSGVGTGARGQPDYYTQQVAQGAEDYYSGAGEAPGMWTGTGAHSLGLQGTLEEGDLQAIFDRRHP
jgi:hypothetical protein